MPDPQIRIDALDPTALPNRLHLVPAMKDGITVQLSVGQILDLLVAAAPTNLNNLAKIAAAINNDPAYSTTVTAAIAAAIATRLPLAGGTMTGPILDAIFAASTAATKKVQLDPGKVTAGQTRKIIVPDGDSFTGLWEPVGQGSAGIPGVYGFSAVSQLAFTGLSAYDMIRVAGTFRPSAAVQILMATSSNNGVSYDNGASDYVTHLVNSLNTTGPTPANSSILSSMPLFGGQTVDATQDHHFELIFYHFNKALNGRVKQSSGYVVGSQFGQSTSIGGRQQATARDAFKFSVSSGTFSGVVTVEGARG